MKSHRHYLIGLIFAVPGAFSFLASFSSFCSELWGRAFCGTFNFNYETFTLGAVFAFITAGEFVLGYKRQKNGELFWESDAQRILRQLGMLAMFAGALVSLYGLYRTLGTSIVTELPWQVTGMLAMSFYAGLLVMFLGSVSILGSRYLKIKPVAAAAPKLLAQRN